MEMLARRPHSVHELSYRMSGEVWRYPPVTRLEERHLVQRCGLTPTDVLHARGQVDLWDAEAARRMCAMFSKLLEMEPEAFADRMILKVIHSIAVELLKKQLDDEVDADGLDDSPAALALVNNMLAGGAEGYRVRVALSRPVIGIGAPASFFIPAAAALLETEAIIPADADVANAIGAITSSVLVHKQVRISPNEAGTYSLHGLPDAPTFADFSEAHRFAVEQLQRVVREMALEVGTSQTEVEIMVHDHIAPLSDGSQLFVGRTLEARLSGRPDLARLAADC